LHFYGTCLILSYSPDTILIRSVYWDDNDYIYENPHILSMTSSFVR